MTTLPPLVKAAASESPTKRALKRFRKNTLAMISLAFVAIITVVSLVSLVKTPQDPYAINKGQGFRPPSWAAGAVDAAKFPETPNHFFLGSDELGRDVFSRLLKGGMMSLSVGFLATFVALLIGVTWGLFAAFKGGATDQVMMRFVDILYSLPYMFFVILLAAVSSDIVDSLDKHLIKGGHHLPDWLKTNILIFVLFFAIGAVSWLTMSRIVRGQVLSLKQKEFVEAARALGVPTWRILFSHILPNCLGPIIIYSTLTVAVVILEESFLSFIGLGVQPPFASWGTLAADGAQGISVYATRWWLVFFPGLMITSTLMAINFVGDGLRDAFDPRLSR